MLFSGKLTSREPYFSHYQADIPGAQHYPVPGDPRCGIGLDGQELARSLSGFQSRYPGLSLVGVRRDGNVLGFVLVHPAAVRSFGCLAIDSRSAIHYGESAKAKRESSCIHRR